MRSRLGVLEIGAPGSFFFFRGRARWRMCGFTHVGLIALTQRRGRMAAEGVVRKRRSILHSAVTAAATPSSSQFRACFCCCCVTLASFCILPQQPHRISVLLDMFGRRGRPRSHTVHGTPWHHIVDAVKDIHWAGMSQDNEHSNVTEAGFLCQDRRQRGSHCCFPNTNT